MVSPAAKIEVFRVKRKSGRLERWHGAPDVCVLVCVGGIPQRIGSASRYNSEKVGIGLAFRETVFLSATNDGTLEGQVKHYV